MDRPRSTPNSPSEWALRQAGATAATRPAASRSTMWQGVKPVSGVAIPADSNADKLAWLTIACSGPTQAFQSSAEIWLMDA